MKKIILNKSYGGFTVSPEAYKLYAEKKGINLFIYETSFKDHKVKYYKKVDSPNDHDIFLRYTTKDYGDETDSFDEKDILYLDDNHREDPVLIEVIEELGEKANTFVSKLKIVYIPDDLTDYIIDDYDGYETLHQRVEIY